MLTDFGDSRHAVQTPRDRSLLARSILGDTPANRMTSYVALLRAVNVGGTGKLPMAQLLELCAEVGFTGARTYITSGNVIFQSQLPKQRCGMRFRRGFSLMPESPSA
jgi:hypothetical protein